MAIAITYDGDPSTLTLPGDTHLWLQATAVPAAVVNMHYTGVGASLAATLDTTTWGTGYTFSLSDPRQAALPIMDWDDVAQWRVLQAQKLGIAPTGTTVPIKRFDPTAVPRAAQQQRLQPYAPSFLSPRRGKR